jgi:hypothetical protein
VMSLGDRGLKTCRGLRDGVRRGDADGVESFGVGERLDLGAQLRRRQKSSFS